MPSFNPILPQIDVNLTAAWTEQDRNRYNKYDYYLVKAEMEARKSWMTWVPLISDTVDWTPNLAEVMKQVIVEHAPVQRQEFRPQRIQNDPLSSIFDVRERTVESRLYWQDYFSPHFGFLPSFQDFLKGNLIPARQNIEFQMRVDLDMFYRTYAWDYAPFVYFVGLDDPLVVAPTGVDANGASNKNAAWMQQYLSQMSGANANVLSFASLFQAFDSFTEDVGATPYEGSGQPGGESGPLNERYLFVTSSSQWNQFTNDPWLKENRPLNMNIVSEAYRGDLLGRIKCKLEKFPTRLAVDANFTPSYPAPQSIDAQSNRTVPYTSWSKPSNAPFEIGYLIGGKHLRRISVGAPPEIFAGPVGDPQKLHGMDWNGKVYATKNFLIPRKDSNGALWYDTNDMGRYVRFQGTQAMGCTATHAFNILPVVYRRRAGKIASVLSA